MKKIARIIIAAILWALSFPILISGILSKIVGLIIPGIIIALIGVKVSGLLPKDRQRELERIEDMKILKEEGHLETIVLTHETGLPIASGTLCPIHYYKDYIKIQGSGAEFKLATNKIMDMTIKTNTEIETFYNSSIGGAVGGALILGPIGAMIGGRKKKKQIKRIENFLVITYEKNDEINFLVFNTDKAVFKVNKFIKIFKESRVKSNKVVEL